MITMTDAQYETLLVAALASPDSGPAYTMRGVIDKANGIKRYTVVVKWQSVPPGVPSDFPAEYPPYQKETLEMTRPITRADVDEVLRGQATVPGLVYVTTDPLGVIGYYELESFPFGGM